ncbi:MAG: dihydrodipicolinate synthase family protein [bacterium]
MWDVCDFKGIVVPLLTPMNETGNVDVDGMRKLVRYVLAGGVHGLFVMGTTGEFPRLSVGERIKAVRTVIEEAKGKVPVYVGVSDTGTQKVLEHIRIAEELGADVLVATPPFYFPPTQEEIELFYKQIASETDLSILIYDIPSTTGVHVDADTVEELSEVEGIVGIKDSSGDPESLNALLTRFRGREDFKVFVGEENLMGEGLLRGAQGAVPSTGNIAPSLFVRLYEAARAGREDEVWRHQDEISDLHEIDRCSNSRLSFVAGRKVALNLMGICKMWVSQPFSPLGEEAFENIRRILEKHNLLG